jgi:hypothetical protein
MLSSLQLLLLLLLQLLLQLAPRLIITCFLALWRAKATLNGTLFFDFRRGMKITIITKRIQKLYLVV